MGIFPEEIEVWFDDFHETKPLDLKQKVLYCEGFGRPVKELYVDVELYNNEKSNIYVVNYMGGRIMLEKQQPRAYPKSVINQAELYWPENSTQRKRIQNYLINGKYRHI